MTDTVLRPPHRIRSRLGKVSYPYNLMAGQRVVEEGEDGLPLFVVTAGALVSSITSATGERVIVGILGPGDVFGDTRLVPDAPPHPEVRSLTRSRLLAVPPGALRRLLEVDESVRSWLLSNLLFRVRTFEHHLARLLPLAVAGRVEVVLRDLAERFGRPRRGAGPLVAHSRCHGCHGGREPGDCESRRSALGPTGTDRPVGSAVRDPDPRCILKPCLSGQANPVT